MNTERSYSRTEHDGLDRRKMSSFGAQPIVVDDDLETVVSLERLGLRPPNASVLPRNFVTAQSPEEFIFEEMTPTIQKLGRKVGLMVDVLGPVGYRSIHEKDAEIVAPVLLFAQSFLVEGGASLTVAFLEHLGHHIASRWGPKITRERAAVLEIVVTNGRRAKRVRYSGPLDGLATIVPVAQRAFDKDDGDDE